MAQREQFEQSQNPLGSIVSSAGTDVGMRREENQDSYGILTGDRFRFYIVADGMGGVQGGAIASNLAISTIQKHLENRSECSQVDILKAAHAANEAIHQKGSSDPSLSGMGTTLVGIHFTPEAMYVIHVGDSRAYRIRDGQITQLTEDHTLVQELVRSGAITEEQAEHHPVSHMLTRSMGPSPQIEIDCELVPGGARPKDLFLLCSDGLYNLVKPSEIAQIVSTNSTDDAVQMLIDLANERGGTDNITVLIISIGDAYKPVSSQARASSDDAEDYVIETIEGNDRVPAQNAKPSKLVGGYHETRDVVDEPEMIDDEIFAADVAEDAPQEDSSEDYEIFEDEHTNDADTIASYEEQYPDEVSSPVIKPPTRLPLIAGGFIGGIFVAYLLFGGSPDVPVSTTTVTAKHIREPIVAPSEPEYSEDVESADSQRSSLPVLSTVYSTPQGVESAPDLAEVLGPTQPVEVERIGPAEKSSIVKRKSDLEELLVDLDGKLSQFDKPLSGEIGEMLRGSTKRAEEIRAKLDQIRSDIDLATRKLAVWYDRRRRLQTTDAVNMASEIAVSVPLVKQKKEEFERATWDYLKEVEALRYSPGSREREAHVSELVRARAAKMKELSTEVKESIDKALSEADHGIAELTLQRSQLESSLDLIKGDMDFVRTVTGNDLTKKKELKDDILRRRDSASTELIELNKLLP